VPPIIPPDERICSVCWGLGFTLPTTTSEYDYPRCIPCPNECNQQENKLRLKTGAGIKAAHETWSLRTGKFTKSIQPAIKDLIALIYHQTPAGFWLLHGGNGVGKTYIQISAINEAIRQGRSAYYTTASEIINEFRAAAMYKDDREAESKLLNKIAQVTILCIDELGRERNTDYAVEKMFQLLDVRYQLAHHHSLNEPAKLTILATNYLPHELEPYLQSRLKDRNSRIVDMTAVNDRRQH
jgi:DNA replication protein DnaC